MTNKSLSQPIILALILYIPGKKETHHYDFPIKFFFKHENVDCHEILIISGQILLKLKCGVDEYRYLPCLRTNHIKANCNLVLEVYIQCHCQHRIPSMLYNCKA